MNKLPFKRTVILGDVSITVYSIGWLAYLVKRHQQTVRKWEDAGVLPRPIFDGQIDKVYRWYVAAEIWGYAKIYNSLPMPSTIKDAKRVAKAMSAFKERAHEFRAKLKKKLADQPDLMTRLPNEQQLVDAISDNRSNVVLRVVSEFAGMARIAERTPPSKPKKGKHESHA